MSTLSKTILFRIGTERQLRMRFGEVAELYRACYFKGKELGYSDGSIYFEWPEKVAFNSEYRNKVFFKCPSHSILPIKFICNGDDPSKFSEIIDITKPDVYYKGSKSLYESIDTNTPVKSYVGHLGYLNKYFFDTGKRPVFNIPKDKLNKPYILFHIRIADWGEYRNPDLNVYRKVIEMLKEHYGDKYEYWKCGEPCRGLDKLFDFVAPYYEELDDFLRLVNNSSLVVCVDSGPNTFAWGMGIPVLEIECPTIGRQGEGSSSYHHQDFWKQKGGDVGESVMDWIDRCKLMVLFKGNPIVKEDIFTYTDKWLQCQD